jgi:DNA-binding CsgD family transcriptional regulator
MPTLFNPAGDVAAPEVRTFPESPRGRRDYGPERLPDDIIVQALDIVRLVRRRVAPQPGDGAGRALIEMSNLRDAEGVSRFIAQAWEATSVLLCRAPASPRELVDVMSQLRRLESAVAAHRRAVAVALYERTTEALARLSRCGNAAELIRAVPEQAVGLGFDRALFSVASQGIWRPRSIHSRHGSEWAWPYLDDRRGIAFTLPVAAVHRRTAHVDEATMLGHPERESGFALWQRSRSKDFWMVPVVLDARVVGLVHADCRAEDRLPTRLEVDALEHFCRQLPLVLAQRAPADAHRVDADRPGARTPPAPAPTDPAAKLSAAHPADGGDGDAVLSQREIEVVRLMAEGLTNAQIGRRLTITEGTVKSHVKRILRKTDSANRAEAVANWLHGRHPVTV